MIPGLDGNGVCDPDSHLPISSFFFFFNIKTSVFMYAILFFNMAIRPNRIKTAFFSLSGTKGWPCDSVLVNER